MVFLFIRALLIFVFTSHKSVKNHHAFWNDLTRDREIQSLVNTKAEK